jgi:tRNA (cytidine/uridine-2'-O-)-methyltransferase
VKLRIPRPAQPFHIVLVEPEIPQNTGNVARLCAATGSQLHLVGRLGFSTDEKAVRRAGLDYWNLVQVQQHADLDECLQRIGEPSPLLFSAGAKASYHEGAYSAGAALVFGCESKGLSPELIARHPGRCYAVPTCVETVRSLNLANAVAVVIYHALGAAGCLDRTVVGR